MLCESFSRTARVSTSLCWGLGRVGGEGGRGASPSFRSGDGNRDHGGKKGKKNPTQLPPHSTPLLRQKVEELRLLLMFRKCQKCCPSDSEGGSDRATAHFSLLASLSLP